MKRYPNNLLTLLLGAALISACGGGGSSSEPAGTNNQAPIARFTATPSSQALSIDFDGSASSDSDGSITGYSWDFGDGNDGTNSAITHSYASAGTYTVTLTVSDNSNSSGATSRNIVIDTQITASIALSLNVSGAIVFDGSASTIVGAIDNQPSIVTYNWNFGDGSSASGVTSTHNYSTLGNFSTTLTVTDSDGNSDSLTIPMTFSLSGVISAATDTTVDVDVNDPSRQNIANAFQTFVTNNTSVEAQLIGNPMLVNGYISSEGSIAQGITAGNFSLNSDSVDYYFVTLLKGQFVSLRIADFDHGNPGLNDVNLSLFDSDLNLVAISAAADVEYESLVVAEDGEYFIAIEAASGLSKYIISIGNSSLISDARAYGTSLDFFPGEAIIKLKDSLSIAQAEPALNLSHREKSRPGLMKFSTTAVNAATGGKSAQGYSAAELATDRKSTLDTIHALRQRKDVEYAEPNYRVYSQRTPNDSNYNLQKNYSQINLPAAWDINTGTSVAANTEVIVAVIDTGVVLAHEDLADQLVPGYDFISDSSASRDGDGIDSNPNDPGDGGGIAASSWHGTHVAGTIAASSNNGVGVAGVSWGAKIMPIRALGQGGGSSYDLQQSLRFAAGLSNDSGTLPADTAAVINLSLSGEGFSQSEQNLYSQIHDLGIIVVAAAGNENSSTPSYPAGYSQVVSVSAVDLNNLKAPYSNFGSTIDITAPGGELSTDRDGDGYGDGILSTYIDNINGSAQDSYSFLQGTSMATPHVAGVAALMKAVFPDLTATDFDSDLQMGFLTNDIGDEGKDQLFGHGIVDALKALQRAEFLRDGTITGSINVSPSRLDFGSSTITLTLTASQAGSEPPTIINISSSVDWLSIDSSAVDANGIGSYVISVDRTGLSDAIFSGQITLSLSNGNEILEPVSMQVDNIADELSDTGYLFVLLLNAFTYDVVSQFDVDIVDGKYNFNFNNIPYGEYLLIAGSDIDNDFFICDIGESCGNYPTNDLLQRISIDSDTTDINFLATIVSGLVSTLTASTDEAQSTLIKSKILRREEKTKESKSISEPIFNADN